MMSAAHHTDEGQLLHQHIPNPLHEPALPLTAIKVGLHDPHPLGGYLVVRGVNGREQRVLARQQEPLARFWRHRYRLGERLAAIQS